MKLILVNPLKVINYSYIKLEYDNFKSTQNNTKKKIEQMEWIFRESSLDS